MRPPIPPFASTSLTVRQLLGGSRRLRIPDYQRAYAWTTAEAGQLLDDVLLAMQDAGEDATTATEGDYFLGAVVLMETTEQAETDGTAPARRRDEVVDGLQRLVTLSILLAILRDILMDENVQVAREAALLVGSAGTGGDAGEHGFPLELSAASQGFFREYVQLPNATATMPDADDLQPAEQRILAVREHLMATLVEIESERLVALVHFLVDHCHCALISTSTLDRAHRIFTVLNDRGSPLSRGDILKAQTLGAIDARQRPAIATAWSDVERRLGASMEELFSHIRTIEGRSRGRIIDDIRDLMARSGGAEAFVRGWMLPHALNLELIKGTSRADAAELPPALENGLAYLRWLSGADWVPPLMCKWRLADGDLTAVQAFVQRYDRLVYALRILGIGADKRATRYREIVTALREDTLDTPPSPIEITRDEQRLLLFNLRSLHARSPMACKLVLLRLSSELAGRPESLDPADFTVEHVLPQKPARTSQWRDWFPHPDERERCTHSLGNLVLVSREANEKARNKELAEKLQIYLSDGAAVPFITRDIQGVTSWRAEDVQRREQRLSEAFARLWKIGSPREGEEAAAAEVPPPPRGRRRRRRV